MNPGEAARDDEDDGPWNVGLLGHQLYILVHLVHSFQHYLRISRLCCEPSVGLQAWSLHPTGLQVKLHSKNFNICEIEFLNNLEMLLAKRFIKGDKSLDSRPSFMLDV
jgi:hypothetical protein